MPTIPLTNATRITLAGLLFGSCSLLYANDSAAEVAAGGIQLRSEKRISMEKERLTISLKKVTVEYEFLNTADQDITTEVAFPIPPYEFTPEDPGGIRDFNDFRVWVEGKEVKYQTEVRAKHNGVDYTQLLSRLGIEIETFGRFPIPDYDVNKSQIGKVSKSEQQNLKQLGLTDKFGFPQWSVVKTHHWNQLFPANKILKVRHEYSPAVGFQPVAIRQLQIELKGICIDPTLERQLNIFEAKETARGRREYGSNFNAEQVIVYPQWVNYILTTANTWKTPIKDFELIVEEPPPADQYHERIGTSVCWDGQAERRDGNHLVAKIVNFVPTRQLIVWYFDDYFGSYPVKK